MEVLPDDRSRWSSESPSFVPFRTKASRHPRPGAFVLSIRVDASSAQHVPSTPAPVIVTVNGTGEHSPPEESYHNQRASKQEVSVAATPTVKVVSEVVRVPPREPEVVSEIRVLPVAPSVLCVPVESEGSTTSESSEEHSVSEVTMVSQVVPEVSTTTVVPVGSVTVEVPAEPMVTDVPVLVSEVRVQTPVAEAIEEPMESPKTLPIIVSEEPKAVVPEVSRVVTERVSPLVVEERTYEERIKGSMDAEDEIDGEMHFHLNVERGEAAVKRGLGRTGAEESAGALLLPGAVGTIRSSRGTVRGVKNRVRAGIAAFLQNEASQGYRDKERGKVVLYTTSMGVVRRTFHKCLRVKQILRTLLVPFEERDASTSAAVREEIQRRLGTSTFGDGVTQSTPSLPQLFVEGQHVGDAEEIERLNETGELRRMLRPFQNPDAAWTCNTCGGYQRLPCSACGGSKRSLLRNAFTEEFVALRCMVCDESGLVRCSNCT